jgi:hypothetical protein
MLHNIKALSLHRVFHGIRFKVNEDWESGKIPFFYIYPCHPIKSLITFTKKGPLLTKQSLCLFLIFNFSY